MNAVLVMEESRLEKQKSAPARERFFSFEGGMGLFCGAGVHVLFVHDHIGGFSEPFNVCD